MIQEAFCPVCGRPSVGQYLGSDVLFCGYHHWDPVSGLAWFVARGDFKVNFSISDEWIDL